MDENRNSGFLRIDHIKGIKIDEKFINLKSPKDSFTKRIVFVNNKSN